MAPSTVMLLRSAVAVFQRSETVLTKRNLQGVLIKKMATALTVKPVQEAIPPVVRIKSKLKYYFYQVNNLSLPAVSDLPIIPVNEARRFIKECLEAVGTPSSHADAMADLLVEADYCGHYSHGMNRLEMYVNDVLHETTSATATPKILKESPATAWVDGNNAFGAVVGNFCMDLAIKKAKEVGVGWVVAKASNHYGIAGWYTKKALNQGLIGLSWTNTSPLMAPTRSKQAALGTNPISVSAGGKDDYFLLDMATTAVALGKIEIQRRKGEPVPSGWAQDADGKIATDAEIAYETGCLMPLGGDEVHSGYKGYGLSMVVDLLGAVLAGGDYGPNVRRWGDNSKIANLGQTFIAVDPKFFAPGYENRVDDLIQCLRNLTPVDTQKPVLVAGDPERKHKAFVDEIGGVQYVKNQLNSCTKLSEQLKVRNLQPLKT